jgi:hypothetical protein
LFLSPFLFIHPFIYLFFPLFSFGFFHCPSDLLYPDEIKEPDLLYPDETNKLDLDETKEFGLIWIQSGYKK